MSNSKIFQKNLARKYGVSGAFVSMAVNGKRNSKLARIIRREYGEYLYYKAATILNEQIAA